MKHAFENRDPFYKQCLVPRLLLFKYSRIIRRAGSRYELPDTCGITNILRTAIGLSTKEFFPFNITRNLQQYGINLYSTVDRETFTVTVETHPEQL